MITRTGVVVPTVKAKKKAFPSHQTPRLIDGLTVVNCAGCQNDTPLYHQARMVVGYASKEGRECGWDNNNQWFDYPIENRHPIIKTFWVCARCYGIPVGKPVIPARTTPDTVRVRDTKLMNRSIKAEKTLGGLLNRARGDKA